MTRSRVASEAGVLLLAWAAFSVPAALAQTSSLVGPAQSTAPLPAPSPSGSGVAPSTPASSASPEAAVESLALVLAAEPATVDVGAETLVVAQVTNTGTAPLPDASVSVVLPEELELVSSFPDGTSGGGAYTIPLGPLDPGESAVAQVTVAGIEPVTGAVVSASATGGSATAQDSTTVSVVEGGSVGGLAVTSRTRAVLTQVGSMLRYEVTVSNEGDRDLDSVLVVDVAPQEVDVVSVDLVDEVEAVQIGESGGRHDIVWNVGSLPAGASVTLPWDGRAVAAGDLRAVNSVRGLIGTTETTRSSSESFLATEGPRAVDNPPFQPIEERLVTFVDPPADPTARAAAAEPAILPFTGVAIPRIVLAGVLLVAAGLLIAIGAALASSSSRKAVAAAVLAGLLGAACVSGGDDSISGAARGATPRTSGTDDPRDDDTQVKGERIVRGDEDDATPAPPSATPRPTAPPTATPVPPVTPTSTAPPVAAPTPVAAPAPVADPAPIRVVRVVTTALDDLPVQAQPSRGGDNTVSFGWDEAAGGITSATSGRRMVDGGTSELLTDLTTEGGAIVNRITLRNTADESRLSVRGRLVHEVYDGSRLVARLRSAPVDVVLSPGGEVVARFSYLVPTGDYTVRAAFESKD